jgi:hypothetical protein
MSNTQYIKIWTDPAESYRHNGTYQTGNKYRLETTTNGIHISDSAQVAVIRIEGIQFRLNASSFQVCVYANSCAAASEVRIEKCIFKDISGTAQTIGIRSYDTDFSIKVANCLFFDFNDAVSGSMDINLRYSGTSYFYNNTHIDGALAIARVSGTVYAKNCLFKGFLNDPTSGLVAANCDYNATDDSSLGYTASAHDRVSQTFTFVDAANDDFHLSASDGGALGFGTNLYNDANLQFQTDIDNQDRGGSGAQWDIGADEYVSAGGVTLVAADLLHAHGLDARDITQKHTLALADILHGHALDAVAATQKHTLALADILHGHALDGVTLNLSTLLSIADLAHGHLLDGVGLTQKHTLAVSGLIHGHSLDSVSFAGAEPEEIPATTGGPETSFASGFGRGRARMRRIHIEQAQREDEEIMLILQAFMTAVQAEDEYA